MAYNDAFTKMVGDTSATFKTEITALQDNVTDEISAPVLEGGKYKAKGDLNEIIQEIINNDVLLKAIADKLRVDLDSHANNKNNPHTTTKEQVKLGNVENYTVTSSVSDPSNTKYATAGAVKAAYDRGGASLEIVGKKLDRGIYIGDADDLSRDTKSRLPYVSTIEDLKKQTKYSVGDVVEVLGYYTKGDGGGHPRQKKPVGYNGADAVIGADGSIWGIVHSGEVNVSWFGTDIDALSRYLSNISMVVTGEIEINKTMNIENSKIEFKDFLLKCSAKITECIRSTNSDISFINSKADIKCDLSTDDNRNYYGLLRVFGNNNNVKIVDSNLKCMTAVKCFYRGQKINSLVMTGNTIETEYDMVTVNEAVLDNFIFEKNIEPKTKNTIGFNSGTGIVICNGYDRLGYVNNPNYSLLNEDTLSNYKGNGYKINDNKFVSRYGRCFSIYNAKNVVATGNNAEIELIDPFSEPTVNDDCYHLEFVKNFTLDNNYINYSGENGIDILSCQNGNVNGNILENVDTWAISLEEADSLKDFSTTIPNIRDLVGYKNIVNANINIHNNLGSVRVCSINSTNTLINVSFKGNYFLLSNPFNKPVTSDVVGNQLRFTSDSSYFGYFSKNGTKVLDSALKNSKVVIEGNNFETYSVTGFNNKIGSDFTYRNTDFITFKDNIKQDELKFSKFPLVLENDYVAYDTKNVYSLYYTAQAPYTPNNIVLESYTLVLKSTYKYEGVGDVAVKNRALTHLRDNFKIEDYIDSPSTAYTNGMTHELKNDMNNIVLLRNIDTSKTLKTNVRVQSDPYGNPILLKFTRELITYENGTPTVVTVGRESILPIPTTQLQLLDTPYHASNMQKLGILDLYHNYLRELHEYEKPQNVQDGVVNLSIRQPPVIPTEVEEYAKEYNSI